MSKQFRKKKQLLTVQHALISTVCNGVNVRSDFVTSFTNIHFYHRLCVDWEPFVGIDCHTKQPRIGLKYKNVVKKLASFHTFELLTNHHMSSQKTIPHYTNQLVYMLHRFFCQSNTCSCRLVRQFGSLFWDEN